MIVTLTGDNYYLISSELHKLKAELAGDIDLGVMNISGSESTLEDIKMELSSYSLFSDTRLIILSEPSLAKGFEEFVEQIPTITPDSTKVVIVEPSLDKRKSYYKYLKTSTDFRQLNKLTGPNLTKWLEGYARDSGAEISATNALYLIDRVGDDQLLLAQEILKLSLYSTQISKQSIDLLTEQSPTSTIFELLDAAFSLNTKKALTIYLEQRLQKVEPEQILAMLSWQLNILAVYMTSKNLTDSEIISASKLSPFTLSKARRIATKVSLSQLKSLVYDLVNLDLISKTISLDLDEGLKNFIVGLNA
jgi:DNA polymerase-3 subunit delta